MEKNQYGTQDSGMTKSHSMTGWNEIDLSGGNQLERGLKSRHIQYAEEHRSGARKTDLQ